MKLFKKFQRLHLYTKGIIIFSIVLLIINISFLGYVYQSMAIYERNIVDNYIFYLASSGKLSENIQNDAFTISKYEKNNANIKDGIKKLYKSDNLKIKKNSKLSKNNLYVYDLYNKDKLISTVSLRSIKNYTKMAILKIDEWEVVDSQNNFDNGLYNYEIKIPINYELYINDKLVSEDAVTSQEDVTGLERLTKYIEIDPSKTYQINNLVYEPEIKILDENKNEVAYEINKDKIEIKRTFKTYKNYDEVKDQLKSEIDIIKLAENWSLFLTDDLHSNAHGFYTFTPYLIKDSYMYQMAYGWAHNVDITFVSEHSLKNPVFTNERLENFIIYNDNAFSVEVYLEKNMRVNSQDKVDVMHDRLYFIYYEGSYKLVNMEAI